MPETRREVVIAVALKLQTKKLPAMDTSELTSGLQKVQKQAKETQQSAVDGFRRAAEQAKEFNRNVDANTESLRREEVQADRTAAALDRAVRSYRARFSATPIAPLFQGLGNNGTFEPQQFQQSQRASIATQVYAINGIDKGSRFGQLRRYLEIRKSVIATRKAVIDLGRASLPVLRDLTVGAAGLALAWDENLSPLARLTTGVAGLSSIAAGLQGARTALGAAGVGGLALGTAGLIAAPVAGGFALDYYRSQKKITEEKKKQAEIDRKLVSIQNEIYAGEARRESQAAAKVRLAERLLRVNRDIALQAAQNAGHESDLALRAANRQAGEERFRQLRSQFGRNQQQIDASENRVDVLVAGRLNAARNNPGRSLAQSLASSLRTEQLIRVEKERSLQLATRQLQLAEAANQAIEEQESKRQQSLQGLLSIAEREQELLKRETPRQEAERLRGIGLNGSTNILSERDLRLRRQFASELGRQVSEADTVDEVSDLTVANQERAERQRSERRNRINDLDREAVAFEKELEGVGIAISRFTERLSVERERVEQETELLKQKQEDSTARKQSQLPKLGRRGR